MRPPRGTSVSIVLALAFAAGAFAEEVSLKVTEPSGLVRRNWPVTSGIPFPEGVLKPGAPVVLLDAAGKTVPLQTHVLATWRDGSVRGLLLDFQTTLTPGQTRTFKLKYGKDAAAPAGGKALARDLGERIEIDTGPLKAVIRRSSWKTIKPADLPASFRSRCKVVPKPGQVYGEPYRLIESLKLNGREVLSDELLPSFVVEDWQGNSYVSQLSAPVTAKIEYNGPERTCIKASGVMTVVPPAGAKANRFKWTARFTFHRGHSTVGIAFAIQRAGRMLWRYEGFKAQELDDMLPIRSLSMEMKLQPGLVGKTAKLVEGGDVFKAVSANGATGGVDALLHTFSRHASAVEITKDGTLRVFLWKHGAYVPPAPEGKEPETRPLAVGQGFRLGAEVFLDFHKPGVKTDMNVFRKRVMAFASPEWYTDSRAFGTILPHDIKQFRDFIPIQKAVLDHEHPDGESLAVVPMPRIYKNGRVVNRGAYLRFFVTGKREYFDLADRRTLSERELPYYTWMPVYDQEEVIGYRGSEIRWSALHLNPDEIPTKWPNTRKRPIRYPSIWCLFYCRLISYAPTLSEYLWHYTLTGERASLELARGRADDICRAQYMMEPSLRGEDGHAHWRRVYGKATLLVEQYYDFTRDPAVLGDLDWMKGEYLMKPYPKTHYPAGHCIKQAAPYDLFQMTELGRTLYRTFGEAETAEVYCVRAADYMIDWHWERDRHDFTVGGFLWIGRERVHEGGLSFCQAIASAYPYTGDPRYMELAEKAYLKLTKNMAARKAFLSNLTKMQGPTPLITTLSRFHYWLDQYRIHRDAKCPPEYAALGAKKIETLLGSEKCAEKRIRLCQALAAKGGAAAILTKIAVNDPDEQVARNAAAALGNVHTDEAVRLLTNMSQSAKRMPVRLASLHSLVRNRKATGLPEQMEALLSDSQPLVRITAARLLFKTDKKMAVAVLTEALKKEEFPYVRKEMLQLLGMTRDRSVIETLLKAVGDTKAHPIERGGAALGLGELGADDPEILQALLIRVPDIVKDFAVRGLVLIGTENAAEAMATRPLLGKHWSQYRSATPMSALGEFTGEKVNRRFAELIMRDDGSVSKRAQSRLLLLLGGRKDAAATEGLKNIAKNHKDEKIRATAAEHLKQR